jgi:hypothetical protein
MHLHSIALQVFKEPENSHGIEFNLRADARVRVQKPLRNCHVSRLEGKNRDKQITTADRVGGNFYNSFSLLSQATICSDL